MNYLRNYIEDCNFICFQIFKSIFDGLISKFIFQKFGPIFN
jgi:hypothetical protein